jgi:hypothetical protein
MFTQQLVFPTGNTFAAGNVGITVSASPGLNTDHPHKFNGELMPNTLGAE